MTTSGFLLGMLAGSGAGEPATRTGQQQIEPGWNEISVPMAFGWWDSSIEGDPLVVNKLVRDPTRSTIANVVIAQLEERYGAGCVEVALTFNGDAQAWFSFLPGETPETEVGNFTLMFYEQDESFHDVGFLLKSLHEVPMILDWTGWMAPA